MNLVTEPEAHALRWYAANAEAIKALADTEGSEPMAPISPRLWRPRDGGPIHAVEASGRATCRACGQRIGKGEQAIVFGFDALDGRGHVADAYIHSECGTALNEGGNDAGLATSPRRED